MRIDKEWLKGRIACGLGLTWFRLWFPDGLHLTDSAVSMWPAELNPEEIREVISLRKENGYFDDYSDAEYRGFPKVWMAHLIVALVSGKYLTCSEDHFADFKNVTPLHREFWEYLGEPVCVAEHLYELPMGRLRRALLQVGRALEIEVQSLMDGPAHKRSKAPRRLSERS